MLTRLIRCTIWMLGALLIFASLDTVPDPPAVDPHRLTVKVPGFGDYAESPSRPTETVTLLDLVAQFETQGTPFVRDTEPDCPAIFLETGQAADPSPPVRVDRLPA